ncbi:MAG: NERD domain-containing protein [Promethearchaeota archaeon]
MNFFTETSLKQFYTEIFNNLRETDANLIEIWLEFSAIPLLKQFNKSRLKEIIGNFNFISVKKGNYQFYLVINKILFIIEALRILELDIREISEIIDYSGFETLIKEILEKNGYTTTKNFRFSDKSNFKSKTTQKRYEIDIIGINMNYILIIDAKQWRRKDSFSSINKAADLQYRRTIALERNLDVLSTLIQKLIKNKKTIKKRLPFVLIPMMVTLEDNSIKINNNQIPLVSIYQLNSFLLELEKNITYFKTIEINQIYIQQTLY